MKTANKLPPLVPFPAAANPHSASMMFVRADARFIDLWEESDVRITYARNLAEVLATVNYGVDGPPENGLSAFACVIAHLLAEAQQFERLAYEAAKRERKHGAEGEA